MVYVESADIDHGYLTHWSKDKMTVILQTTFSNMFSGMNIVLGDSELTVICFKRSN